MALAPFHTVPLALLFTILFLFFFFFSISTFVSAAAGDDCPPSSCGNLTNIRNPFRLKNDPPNCGDSNYELTCDHLNHTILTLLSHNYYVTNIKYYQYSIFDYVNIEIQVNYVGMEKYNKGSCSHLPLLFDSFLTFSKLRSISYYTAYDWVTLVNCSKEVKNKSIHDDEYHYYYYYYYYWPVPCLSHNNNSFIYLISGGYGSYLVRSLMPSCRFLAMLPTDQYLSSQEPFDIFKLGSPSTSGGTQN